MKHILKISFFAALVGVLFAFTTAPSNSVKPVKVNIQKVFDDPTIFKLDETDITDQDSWSVFTGNLNQLCPGNTYLCAITVPAQGVQGSGSTAKPKQEVLNAINLFFNPISGPAPTAPFANPTTITVHGASGDYTIDMYFKNNV
jgi:hypothetical protein